MKPKKAAAALSALAHESRLDIFRLLMQEGEKGLAAGAIAEILHIPSATLSFHLSQLSAAGLVRSTKEGRMVIYTSNHKRLKKLVAFLTEHMPKKNDSEEPETDDDDDDEIDEQAILAALKEE